MDCCDCCIRDYVIQQPHSGSNCSSSSSSSSSSGGGSGGDSGSSVNAPLQLELRGFELQGGTLSLPCCNGCVLEDLRLRHPTYHREILEVYTNMPFSGYFYTI